MVDVLLRADPSRARTDREKQQADEVYIPGASFRVRIQSFFLLSQAWLGLTKSGGADTSSARGVARSNDPSEWRVCASLSALYTRKSLWLAMPKPSARPNVGSRTRVADGRGFASRPRLLRKLVCSVLFGTNSLDLTLDS
jgi:hypothetical protein